MRNVLIKPIITEKSIKQTKENKYTFSVNKNSNKLEVKKAIVDAYKVDVLSVNIFNIKGKSKNFRGKPVGKTRNWKKAIISIKKGQNIKDFEIKE